jgi:hypothetical protein
MEVGNLIWLVFYPQRENILLLKAKDGAVLP